MFWKKKEPQRNIGIHRTLFALKDCPYCIKAILAVIEMNQHLPMGRKIRILEPLMQSSNGKPMTDPRMTAYMTALNGSQGDWGFPVLKMDNPKVVKSFDNYYMGYGNHISVHSSYSHRNYTQYLKRFAKDVIEMLD